MDPAGHHLPGSAPPFAAIFAACSGLCLPARALRHLHSGTDGNLRQRPPPEISPPPPCRFSPLLHPRNGSRRRARRPESGPHPPLHRRNRGRKSRRQHHRLPPRHPRLHPLYDGPGALSHPHPSARKPRRPARDYQRHSHRQRRCGYGYAPRHRAPARKDRHRARQLAYHPQPRHPHPHRLHYADAPHHHRP